MPTDRNPQRWLADAVRNGLLPADPERPPKPGVRKTPKKTPKKPPKKSHTPGTPRVTESEFQKRVIAFAQLHGWRVAHFRCVRVQRRDGSCYYQTPVAADGAGFPDLVLVRPPRLIAAELKVGGNTTSEEQDEWIRLLAASGAETYVWKPSDWERVEITLGRGDGRRPGGTR